ncbi:MAG TPA: RuBisCO large subunit C-terminal-like domain-containing protein [Pelolinea sp.]|nr:RuBisCO large subunit C-terminal-like domain-containing protein [Pelolinea sp.]
MHPADIDAFHVKRETLDPEKYLVLEYYLETLVEPREGSAHLCQEMSTAQWSRVGVNEDFRPKFGAKVVNLEILDENAQPSSPYLADLMGKPYDKVYAFNATIYYPYGNFGTKIPNLLTAVCGEGVFHAPDVCAVRMLDIGFPDSFLSDFQGPQFGVQGLREILGVYNRPLLFGVIKPNVGLAPEPFAELGFQAWLGGLDIAKDDEQLGDVSWSSVDERSKRLGKLRKQAEEETGEKKIYLSNITDEVDHLLELHDIAVANGANALMVNGMTTGFSAVRMLRKHAKVPLVSHFDFMAPYIQLPWFGVKDRVFTKLQRMAGYDVLIYPGLDSRLKASQEDVLDNAHACLDKLGDLKTMLPVPAGSQWAGSLGELYQLLGTVDFAIVPGRAVFGHPNGPKSGAASLRQGWEAVSQGMTLEQYASDHEELRLAIEMHKYEG